ncbi:MAG: hypothetical protein JWL90_1596 [Chthoniobacteraceae bacterium]|nr:hypothetical protein [Chthoniobacteraceae bacterium]
MLSRRFKLIVFIAAMQILGGHWLALQSVAWIGMMASYSSDETLGMAIEKTFNGEHPCVLCKVVKSGRTQEHEEQVAKSLVKQEAVLGAFLKLPAPRVAEWKYPMIAPHLDTRSYTPPTPPPQAV